MSGKARGFGLLDLPSAPATMPGAVARTVSMLDRKPLKALPQKASKPRRKHRKAESYPALTMQGAPIYSPMGCYNIYEGLPIPGQLRRESDLDISEFFIKLRKPWSFLRVGQSFFVPGSLREKPHGERGDFKSRFIYLNGVPGTMVWRVE